MDWQSLGHTALTLGGAFLLGGLIGFERQWRQRLAGLRTNTLVALGAAIFVLFAGLFPGEASPTRPRLFPASALWAPASSSRKG